MSATTLVIQHQPAKKETFMVSRVTPDYKASESVRVPSPYSFKVEGRPHSDLMEELRWYLEDFLNYPFPPETEHSDRVLKALKAWGEKAFECLFCNLSGGALFHAATAEDYSQLTIQIASDDPAVLSWPWEALGDPRLGAIAHSCQVERRLSKLLDPPPLSKDLPQNQINILLVVARPYGEQDVRYRSIARPLVELIEKHNLPAHVDLLRPPTLAQLREHLEQHKGHYHILHFDGHGAYGSRDNSARGNPVVDRSRYATPEGQLVFENDNGEPDLISAAQLNDLLRDYAVPAVVLNACQSGMLDLDSENAYASVAATLLRAGMRSVVAMAYSLYVTGAQEFLPAFYRALFEKGSMAEAVRAGRRQMRAQNKRVGDRVELNDWLLPVLYQQAPLDFSFAVQAMRMTHESHLPKESQREKNPYGFIGRDGPPLALERALRRPPPAILIHGLGGVGKTTLARGFLQWLESTNGLGNGAFWFDFREIRSAEYVFNRMGEAILGGQFGAAPLEHKISTLSKVLHERPFVIVWDNFESVSGIEGTSVAANLPDEDRNLLASLLDGFRGGRSKVIITSRSDEDWLGPQRRWRLPLSGLDGEERWEYCEVILRDLGLGIDRDDPELGKLMQLLNGHPLAMRVILPQLEKLSASEISEALRSNLVGLTIKTDDAAQAQLFSVLQFMERSVPETLRPLLAPMALHEDYVDLNYLEVMAKEVPGEWTRQQIDQLAESLAKAGILRNLGEGIYELHPVLTGFLRSSMPTERSWKRSFVNIMARLADRIVLQRVPDQRAQFYFEGASFHAALKHAEDMGMELQIQALTQALGHWARINRNFTEAERLFRQLTRYPRLEISALLQLGNIAYMRHDLATAEHMYRQAVTLAENQDDERSVAVAYHQMGMIAAKRYNFEVAEEWYQKSLTITERLGDESQATKTYHQIGLMEERRRNFDNAESWYRKSLPIRERAGDEDGMASDYYHLGSVEYQRQNLPAAEQWFRKAITLTEKLGDTQHSAMAYHQLGLIAQNQRNFAAAEGWYRKSLTITERIGDQHQASLTYHQLGRIALEKSDLDAAEQWYRKSAVIKEKLGDKFNAAGTYIELGTVACQREAYVMAEEWYQKSLAIAEGIGNEHSAAIAYYQLGLLALIQNDLRKAGEWLLKSIPIFQKDDTDRTAMAIQLLSEVHRRASSPEKARLEALWAEANLGPFPKPEVT